MMKENFIDFFQIDKDNVSPPLTCYLLEGKERGNDDNEAIIKFSECRVLNSKSFRCSSFYKKISKYEL